MNVGMCPGLTGLSLTGKGLRRDSDAACLTWMQCTEPVQNKSSVDLVLEHARGILLHYEILLRINSTLNDV